jgi:tetratricopeptide (TPR) repeat protein
MKKQGPIILSLALFLSFLIFFLETEAGAAQLRPNHIHAYLRQGIDRILNMENESAIVLLQKAVELDREDPTGYAFLALAHLVFYEMSFNQQDR